MKLFIIIATSLINGWTWAADFCVDTSLGLQQALDTAAANQEANHIMLVQGEYRGSETGVSNTGFKWHHSSADSLIISGGWVLENNQCVESMVTAEPRDTVINGSSFDRAFEVLVGAQDLNFTLTNVHLKFGNTTPPGIAGFITMGGGLKIASQVQAQFGGSVTLDRILFQDNIGWGAAALYVSGAEHVVVRNSAFFRNTSRFYSGLLFEVPDGGRLYFVNNTFRGNQTSNSASDSHAAAEFHGDANSQMLIANNIFWGNDNLLDVILTGSVDAEVWLMNNHFNHLDGLVPDVETDNFSDLVIEVTNDYIPLIGSSYINAAFMPDSNQTGQFIHDWLPGTLDFIGQPRIHGGGLDISAGEENVVLVFQAGFE